MKENYSSRKIKLKRQDDDVTTNLSLCVRFALSVKCVVRDLSPGCDRTVSMADFVQAHLGPFVLIR
jgi:hypothetical protein